MCEIYGMSETELDWEGSIEKKNSSFAELNGREYEMTVLREDAKLASNIYKPQAHGYSLQNRSVTNSQISPMKAGGSVYTKIEMEFGDKDGPSFRAIASATAHDDKGNYGKVEARADSSGKATVSMEAGHDDDED